MTAGALPIILRRCQRDRFQENDEDRDKANSKCVGSMWELCRPGIGDMGDATLKLLIQNQPDESQRGQSKGMRSQSFVIVDCCLFSGAGVGGGSWRARASWHQVQYHSARLKLDRQ
jgi:hypothetical protein